MMMMNHLVASPSESVKMKNRSEITVVLRFAIHSRCRDSTVLWDAPIPVAIIVTGMVLADATATDGKG